MPFSKNDTPGPPGERMEHMKKAFAITGLVLGISAMVAGATAVVFSCLGMKQPPVL